MPLLGFFVVLCLGCAVLCYIRNFAALDSVLHARELMEESLSLLCWSREGIVDVSVRQGSNLEISRVVRLPITGLVRCAVSRLLWILRVIEICSVVYEGVRSDQRGRCKLVREDSQRRRERRSGRSESKVWCGLHFQVVRLYGGE